MTSVKGSFDPKKVVSHKLKPTAAKSKKQDAKHYVHDSSHKDIKTR